MADTTRQGVFLYFGTFTCNGATSVTVAETNFAVGDAVIISLKTIGGTVGAIPSIKTVTGGTGFTVSGTALDTSVYQYCVVKNGV